MGTVWDQIAAAVVSHCIDLLIRPPAPPRGPQLQYLEEQQKRLGTLEQQLLGKPSGSSGSSAGSRPSATDGGTVSGGDARDNTPRSGAVDTDPTDSCTICALKHLTRVSGMLTEADQMLASYDFVQPSIQERIQVAAENLGALEDLDWGPDKVSRSEPNDRALVEMFQPKVRKLRKLVTEADSVEDLKTAAGEARVISRDYRVEWLKSRGLDVGRLTKQVESGEVTMAAAQERVLGLVNGG
ncbi:MAG: hypothetical protein Q8R28_01840 [Dehalococcoidia bacterium]|nr:hypothetical protein [Dehalococcoidia bacterium]